MAILGGNIFQETFGIKPSYFSIILQTNETITCDNGHGATMKRDILYSLELNDIVNRFADCSDSLRRHLIYA